MGKKRVLIADDDLDVLEVIKAILEHEGFQVSTARDGEQAFKMLRKHMFNAVILDVVMPKVSGTKLLQLMRKSSKFRETPVMLLTGKNAIEEESTTKLANDFLTKPFNTRDLIKRVKALAEGLPAQAQQPLASPHPVPNKK